MTRRSVRVGMRALAAASVVALVAAIPDLAQAKDNAQTTTTYDGEATALQTDGLTLTLFPDDKKLPAPFNDIAPRPPEQVIELSAEQLGMPTQFGHAEYRGVDEPGSLPANPLIKGGGFRAASTKDGGKVVSEAIIGHLNLGGGQLTLENIVARCTGNGQQIKVEAPLATMGGAIKGEVALQPNSETPIPGVGTITWNRQVTDGATYGEASNLVIDLQTDLSADALQDLPEAMAAFEDVVQEVLSDLQKSGEDAGIPPAFDPESASLQQLYDTLDGVISEIPTSEIPADLNWLLNASGSITLASAACSQETVTKPVDNPPDDNEPPPGQEQQPPGEDRNEPPLADTGASVWPVRAGVVGLLAIAAGGLLLVRQSRRSRAW